MNTLKIKSLIKVISKFTFALLLSFSILAISPNRAQAAYDCEWSINDQDQLTFCAGGFSSEADAKKHRMEFSCTENCSSNFFKIAEVAGGALSKMFGTQSVDITVAAQGDNGYFSCAFMGDFSADVDAVINDCMKSRIADRFRNAGCLANRPMEYFIQGFGIRWLYDFKDMWNCPGNVSDAFFNDTFNNTLEQCLPQFEGQVHQDWSPGGSKCTEGLTVQMSIDAGIDPGDKKPSDPGLPDPDTLEVTDGVLDTLNPLVTEGSTQIANLSTPGALISRVLQFAFPLAGLILFVMLILGGFGMVAGATDKKALETSKQRITAAIVGFILLFSSFWIMRLVEMIFGLKIL